MSRLDAVDDAIVAAAIARQAPHPDEAENLAEDTLLAVVDSNGTDAMVMLCQVIWAIL